MFSRNVNGRSVGQHSGLTGAPFATASSMRSLVGIFVDKSGKAELHAVPATVVTLADARGLAVRVERATLLGHVRPSDAVEPSAAGSFVSASDIIENDETVLRLFVEAGSAPTALTGSDAALPPGSMLRDIAEDLLQARARSLR